MISNQLYFSWRIIKERLVQNLWTGGIFFLSCLFTLPIYAALTFQRYSDDIGSGYASKVDAYDYIIKIVGDGNGFLKFTIVVAAVVMGCSYFSYLHSKKQVDFYHALPLSRGRLFLSNFIAGNISFGVAYGFNLILALFVVFSMGFGVGIDFIEIIRSICINFIFFNLIFSISIFAGIITGTKMTHALMTLVILEYVQLFFILINEYLSYFFKTFYSDAVFNQKIILSLSPITSYFSSIDKSMLLFQTMALIIILVANIYFFIIRPSENAGKSIANNKLKEIVRYSVLTMCTMAGGLIFYDIGRIKFWLIFGLIFSGIVSYCIIESILSFNMGSILSNKKKLGIFVVIFASVFTILDMDLMNYDNRIPELNQIESIYINPIDFDMSVQNYSNNYENGYFIKHENPLTKIKLSNSKSIEAILKIADISIKNPTTQYEKNMDSNNQYFEIAVKFNMKNGSTMIRKYSYATKEEALPIFANVFDTQEFKYKYYPIFSLNEEQIIKSSIEHMDLFSESEEDIITKEIKNSKVNSVILSAVQEDLLSIKARDLNLNDPIGVITFDTKDKNAESNIPNIGESENIIQLEVPIYREYKKTLDIVNKYSYIYTEEFDSSLIKYIEQYNYNDKQDKSEEKIILDSQSEINEFLETNLLNYKLYLNPFIVTDSDGWAIVYFNTNREYSKDFSKVKLISIK